MIAGGLKNSEPASERPLILGSNIVVMGRSQSIVWQSVIADSGLRLNSNLVRGIDRLIDALARTMYLPWLPERLGGLASDKSMRLV
jgi:hypothetical protein